MNATNRWNEPSLYKRYKLQSKLKEIYIKNYAALCNYATSIIRDKHAAEDLVQIVFIQLWENKKFIELENPDAYLIKCVRYKCIDFTRSNKKRKEVSVDHLPELSVEQQTLEDQDITPLLHFFVSKLPAKTQRVFIMSRQQGKSYKEIAQELDISIKTVENQMGSALRKLKYLLKKHQYLSILFIFS